MAFQILQGDCIELARQLPEACLDAIVSDPPAGIEFLGKEWDSFGYKRGRLENYSKPPGGVVTEAEVAFKHIGQLPSFSQKVNARCETCGKYRWSSNPCECASPKWAKDTSARDSFVAFMTDVAREALRALKPGGYLIFWAIPRTSHWTAWALEEAGFEIKSVVSHLFGSGFPKGLDIGKAMDRMRDDDIYHVTAFIAQARDAAGKTNPEIDDHFGYHGMAGHWTSSKSQPAVPTWENWLRLKEFLGFGDEMDEEVQRLNGRKGKPGDPWYERPILGWETDGVQGHVFGAAGADPTYKPEFAITGHVSEEARTWDGWNTALKPGSEFWVIAQKPLDARNYASNILKYGVGAYNIKGCAVPRQGGDTEGWPSNVVLSHAVLPVLRLAANLPIDTDAQIRRLFHGYSRVSELRRGKGYPTLQAEGGPEVLQPVLQSGCSGETAHSDKGGRGLPSVRGDVPLLPGLAPRRSEEVLRKPVSAQTQLPQEGREESPLGEEAHATGEGKDVQDNPGTREQAVGRKSPGLEGRKNAGEGRILPGYGFDVTGDRTGDCPADDRSLPLHSRTPDRYGDETRPAFGENRACSPYERGQAGQPTGEPGCQGVGEPLQRTQDHRTETCGAGGREQAPEGGDPPLEVLAADVPVEWLEFFDPTGEVFTCGDECHPSCPIADLDRQSGESQWHRTETPSGAQGTEGWGSVQTNRGTRGHSDSGGASRYFNTFAYGPEDLSSFVYVPKPTRAEKDAGCPEAGIEPKVMNRVNSGGLENDPRWEPKVVYNDHPTVKSIALMRWLVRLVARKGATVADLFCGSGTTACAAVLEGCNFIGFDLDARNVAIAQARASYWAHLAEEAAEGGLPPLSLRSALPAVPSRQKTQRPAAALSLDLFGEEEE